MKKLAVFLALNIGAVIGTVIAKYGMSLPRASWWLTLNMVMWSGVTALALYLWEDRE